MKINIDKLIERFKNNVEAHKIETGKYTRYITVPETGEKDTEINAYGCADAANILYTVDAMPKTSEERKAFSVILCPPSELTVIQVFLRSLCCKSCRLYQTIPR